MNERRLIAWARRVGGRAACGAAAVLSHGDEELVVRAGDFVAKAHVGPAPILLADRLREVFAPPLAVSFLAGRQVSLWPVGVPVREPDLETPGPWAAAGVLLARLHREPAAALLPALPSASPAWPPSLPPCGAPARVGRALRRLAAAPSGQGFRAKIIRDAMSTVALPVTAPTTIVHGDFHLGQLIRLGGVYRLIDVDDAGLGDPAWDLARMAAWYAAGVIPPRAWTMFLSAYGAAGGPAVTAGADPWPALEPYARALVVQTAATAVATGDLDTAETFVAACHRMR